MRGLKIKLTAALLVVACVASGCRQVEESAGLKVAPKSLRDVPAARLAFRFEPDVSAEKLPERLRKDEAEEPLATIKTDFETRRGNTDALIRTVVDPSGQRALALYGTSATETDFRIDLYSVEGQFIRNVLPPDLTGVFPSEVAWSPDGQSILFSGIRNPALSASPTPAPAGQPPDITQAPAQNEQPLTAPSVAPAIPSVQTFRTEQVYVGDRDGFNLRPLTSREGLIYFQLGWSPDGSGVVALACKEDEWDSRRSQGLLPAGRPRLITLEGGERLLDDRATAVAPVWSPDGSKVATAFDYDVAIYDAEGAQPGGAGLSLQEQLRAASADYDARVLKKGEPQGGNAQPNSQRGGSQAPGASQNSSQASSSQQGTVASVLISLNPVVRLEWVEPETIFAETAFVRFYRSEPLPTFKYTRWHALHLSPQATVLGSNRRAPRRVI
ncbi:MAG TPA: hypothetical protein VLJ61_04105 [Pyrinomonadaceae bacterium]|nr:hypothetical protein [Pyrinomonadaceae bacterium]